jgi:integrase/recombinase XerD
MSSLRSKPIMAGVANQCLAPRRLYGHSSVTRSGAVGANQKLPQEFKVPKSISMPAFLKGPPGTMSGGYFKAQKAAARRRSARAILLLVALYGLRSGEVSWLLLDDIDWRTETFVITHSKRGGSQLYPLRRDVGDAILKYLTKVRPRTSCRNVFVTISPPYRPLNRSTLYCIVSTHLNRLGIQCPKKGPHSLRHACATHLLQQGASFKEIGDILGHRHTNSVGAYAKVDLNALRTVAKVSLGGLL